MTSNNATVSRQEICRRAALQILCRHKITAHRYSQMLSAPYT